MIFADMFFTADTRFSPSGTGCAPDFPEELSGEGKCIVLAGERVVLKNTKKKGMAGERGWCLKTPGGIERLS